MDERVSSVRAAPGDSPDLADLGGEVAAQIERARRVDADARIARVRERLAQNRPSMFPKAPPETRAGRSRNAGLLAVAATVLLGGIGYAVKHHQVRNPAKMATNTAVATGATPISFTVGAAAKPGETGGFIAAKDETPLHFSDGSELRLAPSARVRVTQVADNGARVLVENGSLHVSVVHRQETRWAIEAGPYEVKVTGTKFTVAYDASKNALSVNMEEGSVVVGGCALEAGTRLRNQESLVVSCNEKPKEAVEPAPPPSAAPASIVHVKAPVDPTRNVVNLARSGQHAEAIAAAEANGWDETLGALSGPELLLLANAGRYAGRFELATAALETTRRRFPGSDAAATAAFELGRIAMDIRRQLKIAGDDFEQYLAERPNGPLAREAMGRAIEARYGAGDQARAQDLANRYLAAWPEGPHASLAKRVTAK